MGTHAGTVAAYTDTIRSVAATARSADDWAPIAKFFDVDVFERVGTFMEVQDWPAYLTMLTGWASTIDRFETTERRVTEVGNLVYFEIEERHFRGEAVNVVNSLTVFDFQDDGKIRHLDVFLQQAR